MGTGKLREAWQITRGNCAMDWHPIQGETAILPVTYVTEVGIRLLWATELLPKTHNNSVTCNEFLLVPFAV